MVWNFKHDIKNIFNIFLDLIYKQKCLVCACAKSNELLCKTCAKDVNYLSSFPQRIYNNVPIFSMAKYEKTIKTLIHILKFKHNKKSAKILAELLFNYFQKLNLKEEYIIVYPESFYLKSAYRGYNHIFLIAKHFSYLSNFKIQKNLILKTKYTKPQYQAKNRHSNIKNSFKINPKYINEIKNKNILLLDDITTSGATLEEIINCFLEKEINNIICLTVSKT